MTSFDDELSRRNFVKLLGASMALAGLDGCSRMPGEKILPYVHQPRELTPGIATHYATAMMLDGFATGLVVESHEGRPTKIEGNPDHPASLGAAGIFEQASLLQLYDSNRASAVRSAHAPTGWEAFSEAFSPRALRNHVGGHGAGLALLLEATSSSVIADMIATLKGLYPEAGIHYYSPLARTEASIPQYDIRAANVILAIESDFLAAGPMQLRMSREFSDRRREPSADMNRLYAIESAVTVTGSSADHRFRCRPSMIQPVLAELYSLLGDASVPAQRAAERSYGGITSSALRVIAADLSRHKGQCLVIAGERQPPSVHALVAAINEQLGNTGRTVWRIRSPLLGAGDGSFSIEALAGRLRDGAVDTLICIGGNPSYNTPGPLQFDGAFRKVRNTAYVGLYENETGQNAKWLVPAAHYLETWGDGRAYDGTLSVVQPLVQPLNGGKSAVEILAAVCGVEKSPLALLRESLGRTGLVGETAWTDAVRRGFVVGAAAPRIQGPTIVVPTAAAPEKTDHIDVTFAADSRTHDGSFANNGWLQELPDPVTKLTWDNAAHLSPATAARLLVGSGDTVLVRTPASSIRLPVLIVAGHADDSVTVHFGYGRRGAERLAAGVGTDVFPMWPATGAFVSSASVDRAVDAGQHTFAITQSHWKMDGREQAKSETLRSYNARQATFKPDDHPPPSLFKGEPPPAAVKQWAMTIDLGLCTGCSACVVACQSENNIPVVGKEDVEKSREMQWLRIDRYQDGTEENPEFIAQPMLCQQCERAPCEYVCPVGATDHSPDGLNEMVYNRCVGTRFCSNNCPYKVRRFNWFDYNAEISETEKMAKNPDVTVRERGVMEKCTFCVQRIREKEISAEVAGTPFLGSSVVTACQQACPTRAITFGSLTEPESEVMRQREGPRAYNVLDELGTRPRVRYLSRIRNANPALDTEQ